MDDYEKYDGLGLAKLVVDGEVTPEELLEACLARIEARNPDLNAVVHPMFERARRDAKSKDLPEGPFHGVPFLLKDLMAEDAGEPSTSSCKLLANNVAKRDSELVKRFKQAGVVIAGRTNTPEFGIYGVTESVMRGPARNPWNRDHTTGGSSGGSAAAVASRMVPLAHGGDGGGSIRIPAAHCGLFGLKPTRARNPMGPTVGEAWSGFVSEHVLTRSVRDSAAMLDATQGPDLGAPYQVLPPARPYLEEVGAAPGKLKIAYTTDALFADDTHADCVAAIERSAKLAEELGHHVEEACPTFDKDLLVQAYLIVVAANTAADVRTAAAIAGRKAMSSDVEPATWLLKTLGDNVSAGEYQWHLNAIRKAARELAAFFADYDVLLTATAARPPVKVGEFDLTGGQRFQLGLLRTLPLKVLLDAAMKELPKGPMAATPNTMLFNMTGQPAMSTPLHWNEAGLPIGTQWVSRFGDETTLFRLAAQLEEAAPWAQHGPELTPVDN